MIRDLEQSVRMLSEQVKYLSLTSSSSVSNTSTLNRASPAPSTSGNLTGPFRHATLPPVTQASTSYAQTQPQQHAYGPVQQQQQQQLPLPPPMHGPWFGPSQIAAPQASHPAAPPPVPSQTLIRTPPPSVQSEEWDDTYLAVLGSQDSRQLRELLARSNPDLVMPLNGNTPLSQAVVLTLVHRVRF